MKIKISQLRRERTRESREHRQTGEQAVGPARREHVYGLVVEVGNRANAWRDAALDSEAAYRWWRDASDGERGDAAAVYVAAIDREEQAAAEFNRALEECSTTVP